MACVEVNNNDTAPEALVLGTRPVPACGPSEVLIQVAYAGVNRPDCLQRAGLYRPPKDASDLLGLEVSGTVVGMGSEVATMPGGIEVGASVCALTHGGGYAEYVAVSAATVLPVPTGLTLAQAAAVPETFFTVWYNVFMRGRFCAGESLCVHGGSSGIGTTTVQLAREAGAKAVFATAGSDEKCAAVAALGATAINYREEDFGSVIKEATGGRGVDLVLDMVGGTDYTARNLSILAPRGRLSLIAFLSGAKADISLAPVMLKQLEITGSTLRPRTEAEKGAIAEELRAIVWPWLEAGRVAPVMHTVFEGGSTTTTGLARAADAHRLMESSKHIGKIVMAVGGQR